MLSQLSTRKLSAGFLVALCVSAIAVAIPPVDAAAGAVGISYVTNQYGRSVTEYASLANGNVAPVRSIVGPSTGLHTPEGIVLDASGVLYVANNSSDTITEYAPGAGGDVAPIRTIGGPNSGVSQPGGLALDSVGNLYVADFNGNSWITVYAPGANGDAAPIRTIQGSQTGLSIPAALAVDASDTLYVANSFIQVNSITVYAAGANGNAAPIRTIAGPNTGLNQPVGVALDSAGTVYVANFNGATAITEYAAGADGNVAPTRKISGDKTTLFQPGNITVDASGVLWVPGSLEVAEFSFGSNGNMAPIRVIAGSQTGQNVPAGVAVTALPGPPGPPTNVVAKAAEASAIVSWSPPIDNGGSPITGYTVTASPGGATVTAGRNASSATVSGLTDGTSYTFTVTAANSGGSGPASAASNAVTPAAPQKFPGGPYNPVVPARLLDTRSGLGGSTIGGGQAINVQIAGKGGVPAAATGVVLNVTVATPSADGYLTIWPAGGTRPLASSLNFSAGQTIPNLVQVALGTGGAVSIFNSAGASDVLADVQGYTGAAAKPGAGLFTPVTPSRLLDTRSGGTLGDGGQTDLQVTGAGGVPASGVSGVVLNVTVTNPSAGGYLTIWPAGAVRPLASNLNFTAGLTIPNRVEVQTGTGGRVSIFNFTGSADVIVDVNGWYSDGSGTPPTVGAFTGVTPTRLLDTRSSGSLGPGGVQNLTVTGGPAGLPTSGVTAVVLNVTVTNPSASGFLTVWPAGAGRPTASDLNFSPGQTIPNLVVVGVSSSGAISIFNFAGSADVIVDIAGWYS